MISVSHLEVVVDVLVYKTEVFASIALLLKVAVVLTRLSRKLSTSSNLLGTLKCKGEILSDESDLETTLIVIRSGRSFNHAWSRILHVIRPAGSS